jgi:hypothetical protein
VAKITKHTTILRRVPPPGFYREVYFDNFDDDKVNNRGSLLSLEAEKWEELGSPDILTMTIEPGDLLNV